ncbi:class I SAM-dependent methyltransferase [Micrococcus porci]|uniref:O-methyltransferase n=1 Tax=Micrococcus TaxID=1269 RepID=UPI001CCC8447|nr:MULTISPECIES: class I SAM-dependent methyltransferase [Micrococcus]MCG7421811.1 class I SAM-dependent methyltransferase [Micrococcus sp. ACRRV]UBH25790.1 class I SAM-dependent methyltransferase [Micrococcus porci]
MSALHPQPTDKHASWAWAEARTAESEVLLRARERSAELGVRAVGEGTSALLTVLAATRAPSAVVEIGTGAGVSGLALMRGLPERTVLTTVDPDAEAQRAAREAFSEAHLPTSRTRMISGRSRLVLPRLTTGAYEMVVVDGEPASRAFDVEQAARMLAPGGLLVVVDALDSDRVPRAAVREDSTVSARDVDRLVREDEAWVSAVVPTGTGVLLAVRR